MFHICWEVSAQLSSGSLTPSIFTTHVSPCDSDPPDSSLSTPQMSGCLNIDVAFASSFKWEPGELQRGLGHLQLPPRYGEFGA